MSHYAVGVITKNMSQSVIDTMMAPYDENLEDWHIDYTHEEYIEEARKTQEEIRGQGLNTIYERIISEWNNISLSDVEIGIKICGDKKWDENTESAVSEYTKKVKNFESERSALLSCIQRCHTYYRIFNATNNDELFDAYRVYDGNDNDESVDEDGNILSYRNRQAKYDYYTIGGRWENYIKKKDGYYCNYAKIKDIDFTPDEERYKKAERMWEIAVEGKPKTKEEENYCILYKSEYYIGRYRDKETYARIMSLPILYAIVNENGWNSKGNMGWWGMSSESHKESLDWDLNFYDRFLKDADPESYLVVLDCHI